MLTSDKRNKKYPIAEIFTSPQGEGVWTGTLMTFIRLAGCSVGQPMTEEKKFQLAYQMIPASALTFGAVVHEAPAPRPVPAYTRMCTTYDGREFLCDTDYQTKELMTVEQIVNAVPKDVSYICLTGGEPLMYNLCPLMEALYPRRIHIETSGTRLPVIDKGFQLWFPAQAHMRRFEDPLVWLTVSPKKGILKKMLQVAHEIKILVNQDFKVEELPFWDEWAWPAAPNVFLQPINHENDICPENLQRVRELQLQYTFFRISTQMHKIWRVR